MSPKIKIDKEEAVIETTSETIVEKKTKDEYPEVGTTGKFNAVSHGGGYVVYNPSGQRVTGVINDKATVDDIVRQANQAAHIKG